MHRQSHPRPQLVCPKSVLAIPGHTLQIRFGFGFVLAVVAGFDRPAGFPLRLNLVAALVGGTERSALDFPIQSLWRRLALTAAGVVAVSPASGLIPGLRPAVFLLAVR